MSQPVVPSHDALLVVSFGGPERREDVVPFLENVLRGKSVPRDRLLAVAEHYYHFGGASPLNAQNRALIAALDRELAGAGLNLPVYLGNRNWTPYLAEALAQMASDGVRRALAFFTSAYSSYSGCRQYRENIAEAQRKVGPAAPQVDKLRVYFNHPGFIEPMVEHTTAALLAVPAQRRAAARLVFTAHSIPTAMAAACAYQQQLASAASLVASALQRPEWDLVYQSRSGPPSQPWLEPDIGSHLDQLASAGVRDVVVAPIGFISDHLEVLYDLDFEARQRAERLGIHMVRAATVGTHWRFVAMIRQLIEERLDRSRPRLALGALGPGPDVCPEDCCLPRGGR